MQRLLRILLCFSYFGLSNLNADQELMEMNFRKQRRFLFIRYPFTKNSISCAKDIMVWNIQFNLFSLFFRVLKILIFSCFSVHIAGHIRIDWRWTFKNQERFLFITDPFTKTSLRFYTCFTDWEIWKLLLNLFFRNSPYLPGIRFCYF